MKSQNIFNKIKNEIMPYGYYYNTIRVPTANFDVSEKELRIVFKKCCKINGEDFLNEVKTLNEITFTKRLNIEYSNYKRHGGDIENWIEHTTKLLQKRLRNPTLYYAFEVWVKDKNIEKPKAIKTKQYKEPTLKELALFHIYLGSNITKDNADDFLKGTSLKSGGKLKQHYDEYQNTNNRINSGTDRENGFRLKLFKKVIAMLSDTGNTEALNKAQNELIQFEKRMN